MDHDYDDIPLTEEDVFESIALKALGKTDGRNLRHELATEQAMERARINEAMESVVSLDDNTEDSDRLDSLAAQAIEDRKAEEDETRFGSVDTPNGRVILTGLTKRWHPAMLSDKQYAYLRSQARINLVASGRRSFKTEGAKRRLVRAALTFSRYADGRFYACGPTQQQSKDIFWDDLKALVPDWALLKSRDQSISESELTIELCNGAVIRVAGLDKPARIEGRDWDGGVVTEYGNCKAGVFDNHIRPMMIRGGYIDIEGTPEGHNHYYKLVRRVQSGELKESAYFHWTTEEVLHYWIGEERAAAELAHAKSTMDELSYQQEYLGDFVLFEGRAYYCFTEESVRPIKYDPRRRLILCFDFNVEPGVAAVCQEIDGSTCVIGEVWIPRNSNTPAVCRRIKQDWGHHKGGFLVCGDATGGSRGTAQTEGSDWELIRTELRGLGAVSYDVPRANPAERARVNAMNSRIKAADGTRRLFVDPKCKHIIEDLEGVALLKGGSGEIDKKHDPLRSHISDALGYYVVRYHPVGDTTSSVSQI